MSSLSTEVKLIGAICLSVIILAHQAAGRQLGLLLFLLAIAFAGNIKPKDIFNYVKIFLPVFAVIFLINLFYYDGQLIFRIWFLKATQVGLYAGLSNTLRFFNLLIVATCFFAWTSPLELSSRITSAFGNSRAGFLQDMAMVFFIAMRFLPVLSRERSTVRLAMEARGARFDGGLLKRIRMNTKLILPLFSRTIAQVDDVAIALALKSHGDTFFAPAKSGFRLADGLLIAIFVTLTVAVVIYA